MILVLGLFGLGGALLVLLVRRRRAARSVAASAPGGPVTLAVPSSTSGRPAPVRWAGSRGAM